MDGFRSENAGITPEDQTVETTDLRLQRAFLNDPRHYYEELRTHLQNHPTAYPTLQGIASNLLGGAGLQIDTESGPVDSLAGLIIDYGLIELAFASNVAWQPGDPQLAYMQGRRWIADLAASEYAERFTNRQMAIFIINDAVRNAAALVSNALRPEGPDDRFAAPE